MYSRKNNENKTEKVYFDMAANVTMVTNVREITKTCIGFTLKCKGFSLYGLRAVQKKDDPDSWFISVPSTKGKDGKYYNNYGLYLRDEDTEAILNTVFGILDSQKG